MQPFSTSVSRFEPMHPWANRILHIDLSDMSARVEPSSQFLPDFLGSRGLAARLCWRDYPEPVPAFAPENPLMVVPGALTGSRAPYSGRTTIHAFSPQASPYEWFTRSSIGGRFGGELKRAGYDVIVVTGAAETPVRVQIHDDQVRVLPAEDLWGLDIYDALEALDAAEGRGSYHLTIGPAGERLSRIATIQSGSSTAAGQGGFGGVMGSKKLKGISVVGTGRMSLAEPEAITAMAREIARRFKEAGRDRPFGHGGDLEKLNQDLAAAGDGRARCEACTEGCLTPCMVHFEDMPGSVFGRKWSGVWTCAAMALARGCPSGWPARSKAIFDWRLDRRAGFEMNVLANRYGLNQFDVLGGMAPWLIACQKEGSLTELNGQAMDWDSPSFWAQFLHATAYREGLGDVLAEGGWRAAQTLHAGEEMIRCHYPGWGHAPHHGGQIGAGNLFPHWLVSALQWLSDTRDPFNSGHGSRWPNGANKRAFALGEGEEREAALDTIRAIGQRLYGSADAVSPYGGYGGKASMGHYHTLGAVILDCVPVDDLRFPVINDPRAPDGLWRFDVDGLGEIEGPSVEYHLFRAGTGLDWPEAEFGRAVQRVATMERALQVRHWGRDRQMDEMVLPFFEREEASMNPLLDEAHGLDREQFAPVLTEFYGLNGWDANGQPTREGLESVGQGDMYEPMKAGAAETTAALASDRTAD